MKKTLVTIGSIVGLSTLASAQDAGSLAGQFTSGISGNETLFWTIGGAVAAIAAVTVVIKLVIRNGKSVGNAA